MFTVRCGTCEFETALIIFAPSLMIPRCSYSLPDHVSGRVLEEQKRRVDLVRELDELGRLVGLLR